MFPLEVSGETYREDRTIVAGVILTQYQRVTDRQTDGRTDGLNFYFYSALQSALQIMLTRCKNCTV